MMSVRTTPASNTPIISVAYPERDAIISVALSLMSETKLAGSVGIIFVLFPKC